MQGIRIKKTTTKKQKKQNKTKQNKSNPPPPPPPPPPPKKKLRGTIVKFSGEISRKTTTKENMTVGRCVTSSQEEISR